jgi:hypothetical protein
MAVCLRHAGGGWRFAHGWLVPSSTALQSGPEPFGDLGAVGHMLLRIGQVEDDLVLQPLYEMRHPVVQPRLPVAHIDQQVEAVDLLQDYQFEWRVDVAFFL